MRSLRADSASQRGVVLFLALVVLLVATIAGLAMMRSTTANVLVSGNLGFKRSVTAAGDFGVEAARAWLIANGSAAARGPAKGFVPTWDERFDPRTHDWNAGAVDALAAAPAAARPEGIDDVRYVIHRLCAGAGPVDPRSCVIDAGGSSSSTQRGRTHGEDAFSGATAVLYRVTVRVIGAKGTTSYIQSLVY